jgi:parvulin-like peptidyl-prolyl isomerase
MASELAERLHIATRQLEETSAPDEYTLNRLRETALKELIEKRLITQKAREQNVTVTEEEFQQFVQQVQDEYNGTDIRAILEEQEKSYDEWEQAQREAILLDKLIDINMKTMIVVTPEEIQQYYEQNKGKYDHPAQVRASQILTYEEEVARKALQEIRSGTDFAQIAEKYSESPDAKNGGDLGFFAKGVMPPEFDEVIFSMKMGEVSDVIKTPYGYQIFKLTGQREAHRVSFEEVKDQIENMLKKQKQMFVVDLWMNELQSNAKILLNHKAIKQVN